MGLFSKKSTDEGQILHKANYLGSVVKVFPDRVEHDFITKQRSIPMNTIASIDTGVMGYMGVTIETTGGEKILIPTHKKQELKNAIYNAKSVLSTNTTSQVIDNIDQIIKLSELKEKGIITQDEFDKKKKQLLDI